MPFIMTDKWMIFNSLIFTRNAVSDMCYLNGDHPTTNKSIMLSVQSKIVTADIKHFAFELSDNTFKLITMCSDFFGLRDKCKCYYLSQFWESFSSLCHICV